MIAPVSMIITTHNRADLLAPTLRRFAGLTKPAQLIVVDDGGSDDTERVCDEAQSILHVEYIRLDHPGETNCCWARNVGLKAAVCDEIVVCEPEVMFLTDVISQLLRARKKHPDDLLYGGSWHADDESAECRTNWHSHCTWIAQFPYYYLVSARHLFDIGGWDEAMPGPWGWDDMDLYTRLRHQGHETVQILDVEGYHQWHPSRIEPAVENERYVRAKTFPEDLIANRGVEWGIPKH